MNIVHQKYIILLLLFSINSILSSTFLLYTHYWYIYLVLLALASITNAASSLLNLCQRIFIKNTDNIYRLHPINYTYIVPCYNESENELRDSINSITIQQHIPGDKRSVIIICDGKVTGSENDKSTDIIKKYIKSKFQIII
jgi:chitin synthase